MEAGGVAVTAADASGMRALSCLDCGESGRYFTSAGESRFRLSHLGHRVVVEDAVGGEAQAAGAPGTGPSQTREGGGPDACPKASAARPGSFESVYGSLLGVRDPEGGDKGRRRAVRRKESSRQPG